MPGWDPNPRPLDRESALPQHHDATTWQQCNVMQLCVKCSRNTTQHCHSNRYILIIITGPPPVASLGLVSPGAATDGCHAIFSWKNLIFFSHRPLQVMTFLAVVSSPLPSSRVVYTVFFLNSATKKKILGRVSRHRRVSSGAVPQWRHCPPIRRCLILLARIIKNDVNISLLVVYFDHF